MLFFKTLLYISSYIPILLMIFLNNLEEFSSESILDLYCTNVWFWNSSILILLISISSFIVFIYMLKNLHKQNKDGTTLNNIHLKSNEGETLSYFITYLVPLLTLDINNLPSICMNVILIVLIGIYFVKNNFLHFNVLLLLFNYRIYTDEDENIYISKKTIINIKVNKLKAYNFDDSSLYYIK